MARALLPLAAAASAAADDGAASRFISTVLSARPATGRARVGSPKPNNTCVEEHCLSKVTACGLNKDCRGGMLCVAGCKAGNQQCIFQCSSDYESTQMVDLMRCMFTTYDCTGGMATYDPYQVCRSLDTAAPMTTYRGAALTAEAARGLLLRGHKRGDWVVSGGLSHAYDCFDCQYLYFGDKGDTTMEYLAEYKIHKSNGGIRWNQADYIAINTRAVNAHFAPAQPARLSLNASDYGGLFHAEDWRILAVDEKNDDPQWLALYYCGGAPGVQEAYEGACMLTVDGMLPTDPTAKAAYVAAYAKAGITLDCVPDNSNCTGHPEPPFPPGRF